MPSAYHSAITFFDTWTREADMGASTDLENRPVATANLYDNTTVTGSWVLRDTSNVTAAYERYHRVINNVSLAMPHAGVYAAARDEKNSILQPEELGGVGEYILNASVVSPTINVLCVNLNQSELAPLIYTEWPGVNYPNNSDSGQRILAEDWNSYASFDSEWGNSTAVDDIFEWGEKYGRYPPIFPMVCMRSTSGVSLVILNFRSFQLNLIAW
jgi:hypothetical protein